MALMLREMSSRYGRSAGGYVWAVVEPLAAILILSFGFALVLRSPSLGNSFILFYATGYLPYNLFQTLSNTTARSIAYSKPLLMYPVVTWMDAVLARFILNLLTAVLITYLLLTGILILIDTQTLVQMGPLANATLLAALLGLGVGTLNCAIGGLYPVYYTIWAIATRPMFLASGVIYIYEDLPRKAQAVLWYNPLLHITGEMRTGIYPTYAPQYINEIYVLGFGLVTLFLGLVLLRRYHRDILNA